MSRVKIFVKYWLPLVLWMSLIFSASADAGSAQRSSRIIGPLVRWLFPGINPAAEEQIVFGVRKAAHVTEYGIFAVLIWRALRRPVRNDPRPWNRNHAVLAVTLAFLYALTDELHQRFVPNREGRFHDVAIDTAGAALAILLVWACFRWRSRLRSNGRFPQPSGSRSAS